MEALAVKATVKKHVHVLRQILGSFERKVPARTKAELLGVIDGHRRGLVPLAVPLTLIERYAQVLEMAHLLDQVYLNPYPKELMFPAHIEESK